MKDLLTMLVVSVVSLLLALSAAHASTLRLRSRSTDEIDDDISQMHLADGILRDLMMIRSDHNRDNKLSASEITWFYRYFVHYSEFVAKTYGERFISIADHNGDGLLDGQELLRMLVAMNAVDILKR